MSPVSLIPFLWQCVRLPSLYWNVYREQSGSGWDQQIKIDKKTTITELKRKNYSNDPSKSIMLDAFSVVKTVRGGIFYHDVMPCMNMGLHLASPPC